MFFKKTKIVGTMGPACESPEMLAKLIDSGLNVARLNMAHGNLEEHAQRIALIRKVSAEKGVPVAILIDVKGPEIRTHLFENDQALILRDSIVRVAMKQVLGTAQKFSISYPGLFDDVQVGQKIRFEDGKLTLTIIEKDFANRELVCRAFNTHMIKNRRNCNAPFARLGMPFISQKDRDDVKFSCDQNVDYVATSFTRRAQDVFDVKALLAQYNNSNIRIIAKIENQEGIDNFDEILKVADGIMVARGDLGVEVEPEEVPILQKEFVRKCQAVGKPVIVATQMLDSMTTNPNPTRAEVTDVANAVLETTDCVMLSVETASGQYPAESVQMQAKIAHRIEGLLEYHRIAEIAYESSLKGNSDAIAFSVANTAILVDAALIVAISLSGSTPIRISRFRPQCPIIAVVPNQKVYTMLAMHWGVYPHHVDRFFKNVDEAEKYVVGLAKANGVLPGRAVIMTGGNGTGSTNFMKIITIE